MTKKERYNKMLDEVSTADALHYLTIPCSSRSKQEAAKAKRLISTGNYAEALRIADPIAYQVGLNEFN